MAIKTSKIIDTLKKKKANLTNVINIRLSPELKLRFERICKRENINSSELIRELMEDFCTKYQKK